jgi:hypothetical protein
LAHSLRGEVKDHDPRGQAGTSDRLIEHDGRIDAPLTLSLPYRETPNRADMPSFNTAARTRWQRSMENVQSLSLCNVIPL